MPVPEQPTYVTYIASGVAAAFPYPFLCFLKEDLTVLVDGDPVDPSAYTVTGLGQMAGGSVVFLSQPAAGARILIVLSVVLKRVTDYALNGDLRSKMVNEDFDRIWLAMQGAGSDSRRALKMPIDGTDGTSAYDAKLNRIQKLANPVDALDAATMGFTLEASLAAAEKATAGVVGGYGFFQQPAVGAVDRTFQEKQRERISVYDFGAKGDGIADDTASLQAAINYLQTSRQTQTSGMGRLYLGRGTFLINGTITADLSIGLEIAGESSTSSVIKRTVDTGDLFSCVRYSGLSFRNMSFLHTSPKSGSASWTTVCFALNGTGGGQMLRLDNVRTIGFNRVFDFRAINQNEDTTYVTQSRFTDFNTMLYSRSSQAVVNLWEMCTIDGTVTDVFNIGGYGHTHLDTCNVVMSGCLFRLGGGIQGPQSQYICTNVKMEYWPQTAGMGTTQIVKMDDAAYAQFRFIGGGLAGGAPDASVFQLDLKPLFAKIRFEGGSWDAGMKIRVSNAANTTSNPLTNAGIVFDGCMSSPLPSNVTFAGGGASVSWAPVVWRDCPNRPNLCVTGSGVSTSTNSAVSGDYVVNRNTSTGVQFGGGVMSGTATTHAFPHYGQRAFVKSVRVGIIDQGAVAAGNIKAYADAAKTQLIGTIAMTAGASTTPKLYSVPIPDSYLITEGVYVEMSNTSSVVARGRVYVETESV